MSYAMSKEEAKFIINYLCNLEFSLRGKEKKDYNYKDHVQEAHEAYLNSKKEG